MKRIRIFGFASVAAIMALAPASCGSDGGESSARRALCSELAAVDCRWYRACFNWAFRQYFDDDLDACEAALGHTDECLEWMKLSGVTYETNTHLACTAFYDELRCGEIPRECLGQPGELDGPAACISGAQCASGRCSFPPYRSLAPSGDGCGSCDPTDDYPRALGEEPPPREGSCEESYECGREKYCNEGECVPRLEVGAPCVTGEDVCVSPSRECIEGVCKGTYDVFLGDVCGQTELGYGECVGSRCAYELSKGRCVEWTPRGAPCEHHLECGMTLVGYRGVCRDATADMCRG